jgi:hypothetical protein
MARALMVPVRIDRIEEGGARKVMSRMKPAQAHRGHNAQRPKNGRVQAARVSCQVQFVLNGFERSLRGKARGELAQAPDIGQQHALGERLRQLDFFERQRLLARGKLRQACVKRIRFLGGAQTDNDENDRHHQDNDSRRSPK